MKEILDGKRALEIQKMNIGQMSEEERRKMDLENERFFQELTRKTIEILKTLKNKNETDT